ncbi:hypothetical protein CF597_24920 [Pseudomonas sp. PSB1]|nr:hypothetical protein [Pseudomonas sp. PSB1]
MGIKCGSELARDSGVSVNIDGVCNTAIASKLAPTGGCGALEKTGRQKKREPLRTPVFFDNPSNHFA